MAENIPIAPQTERGIETGQLADERQFLAALLRVDGGWMAVVHYFAFEGEYLDSEHSELVPGGEEPSEEARSVLNRMLRQLEPYRQDPITVRAFETELAGRRLGLTPEPDGRGLRLEPNGPVLTPPAEDASED